MNVCKTCGILMDDGEAICPVCGASIMIPFISFTGIKKSRKKPVRSNK